jgi:hypothetical protein
MASVTMAEMTGHVRRNTQDDDQAPDNAGPETSGLWLGEVE